MASKDPKAKPVKLNPNDYEPAIVIITRKGFWERLKHRLFYNWPVAHLDDAVKAKGGKR